MKTRVLSVILLTVFLFVAAFTFGNNTTEASAAQTFERVDFISGVVTAHMLNLRKGPSTDHQILATFSKDKWVNVLAKIGDWYAVYDPDSGLVGCVYGEYLMSSTEYKMMSQGDKSNTSTPQAPSTSTPAPAQMEKDESISLSDDEKLLMDLINAERSKAGLSPLKVDPELQRVARLKAKDMVDNNYFSHQSPTYGSPFVMMRQFGVTFKTAGENIAGNSTEQGAVTAWMNSEGHKKNILNGNFNYTGIGIYNSPKYGKVFVQMFIGR